MIAAYHERLIKKEILGFLRGHPVAFAALVCIGIVPIKPDAIAKRIRHIFSIRLSYTYSYARRTWRSIQCFKIGALSRML